MITKKILKNIFKVGRNFSAGRTRLIDQGVVSDTYEELKRILDDEKKEEEFGSEKKLDYTQSELKNGIKLITESPDIPNYSTVVFQVLAGSQFEDSSTQASTQVIENLINYHLSSHLGFLQEEMMMVSSDREVITIKVSCMHYQMPEILSVVGQMFHDSSFITRTSVNEAVQMFQGLGEMEDLLTIAALGRYKIGAEPSPDGLNYESVIEYYQKFFVGNNLTIVAGNIENHKEFEVLVDHFFPLEAGERASELVEDYQFETNMLKIPDDNDGMFDFAAVWPCPSWSNEDSYNFFVLSWLIGNSSSFVSGGPGRGMHSRAPKIINSAYGIEDVTTVMQIYKNLGLFGLHLRGYEGAELQLVQTVLVSMRSLLYNISEQELSRAKNCQNMLVTHNLMRQVDRIEEIAKNIHYFGRVAYVDYSAGIESVTLEGLNQTLTRYLQDDFCVVARGKNLGNIGDIGSYLDFNRKVDSHFGSK